MSILLVDGKRVETSERVPLEPAQTVKVHIPVSCGSIKEEAPWAEVIELLPDGKWLGRIVNQLIYAHDYAYGDAVVFERISDGSVWWWQPVEGLTPARAN